MVGLRHPRSQGSLHHYPSHLWLTKEMRHDKHFRLFAREIQSYPHVPGIGYSGQACLTAALIT